MHKLNILIISQYFAPEDFRINDLVLGLRERGHKVTVLAGTPNYPQGRYYEGYGPFRNTRSQFHGAKVRRVPIISRGRGSKIRLAANYISYALSASLLGPFLCRENYDVIFTFQMSPVTVGIPALVFRRMKKAPMIFWIQDLWPDSLVATSAIQSKMIVRAVGWIVRKIYRGSDLILLQSRAFVESVQQYGADLKKIAYFPNSAEAFYRPVHAGAHAPESQILPLGFRIMFAGNIGVAQDFTTILSAAYILRNYSDIRWVIVGDGSQRDWVELEVNRLELNDQVKLIGRYPPESMPALFALADALLVTLKRDPIFEVTIPSKIQSYLACGRPIIAALDGEGARVVEEARAGFVAPPEQPELLAQAILRLYNLTKAQRESMGQAGRAYFIEQFERERLLDALIGWMDQLRLGSGDGGSARRTASPTPSTDHAL